MAGERAIRAMLQKSMCIPKDGRSLSENVVVIAHQLLRPWEQQEERFFLLRAESSLIC